VREAGRFLTAHCGDALNLAQGPKPLAATQFRFSIQTPKWFCQRAEGNRTVAGPFKLASPDAGQGFDGEAESATLASGAVSRIVVPLAAED
jgi:hypothetical protein